MMRTNKNGEPAISREIWAAKAFAYRGFSDALTKLLSVHKSESETQLYAALREMIETQDRYAVVCDELKQETKKGRPPNPKPAPKVTINHLKAMMATHEGKRRPGRPSANAPRLYRLTFEIVERKRASLAAQNRVSTIKAAIDAVNSELALKFGEHESTYVAGNYHSVRSHYGRGKRLFQA